MDSGFTFQKRRPGNFVPTPPYNIHLLEPNGSCPLQKKHVICSPPLSPASPPVLNLAHCTKYHWPQTLQVLESRPLAIGPGPSKLWKVYGGLSHSNTPTRASLSRNIKNFLHHCCSAPSFFLTEVTSTHLLRPSQAPTLGSGVW